MLKPLVSACVIGAVLALSACSETPDKPLTDSEAVLEAFDTVIGKSPTALLEQVSANFYDTFSIAKGVAGERGESWDEARFAKELKDGFAPYADQIDATFAGEVAATMKEGEAQELVDMLAQGKNSEYAQCAFNSKDATQGNRLASCAERLGLAKNEKLDNALGAFATKIANTLQANEKMAIAVGYVTCGVLAKFGKEVSTEDLSIGLETTEIGIGADKKPCPEYDALAAKTLKGDVPPHFEAQVSAE